LRHALRRSISSEFCQLLRRPSVSVPKARDSSCGVCRVSRLQRHPRHRSTTYVCKLDQTQRDSGTANLPKRNIETGNLADKYISFHLEHVRRLPRDTIRAGDYPTRRVQLVEGSDGKDDRRFAQRHSFSHHLEERCNVRPSLCCCRRQKHIERCRRFIREELDEVGILEIATVSVAEMMHQSRYFVRCEIEKGNQVICEWLTYTVATRANTWMPYTNSSSLWMNRHR
jgi:hypothetical protein